MAIQLSDNVNLIAPKILDNRYGPWNSVAEANTKVSSLQRSKGLTVGILSGSSVVEYWYYTGITDSDLVLKKSTPFGNVVSSVDLEMPSAFTVTDNPITSSGKIKVTANGTASQYIRGDGSLANFPDGGGGGGGVSNVYYLNGSVNQGTFSGATYNELNRAPVLTPATDFTRLSSEGDGYIAYFITDPNDPNKLKIPAGAWRIETFFNASTNSGSPQFYCELYKVSSTNVFTLISSSSANPETITNGTTIDLYLTLLSVPETTLLETDRFAIRIYVITDGNDVTLHTQGDHISEVTTTFVNGIESLNGLSTQIQTFAQGESGNNFNISSTGNTHTFNLPIASSTKTGKISTTDWVRFDGKQEPLVSGINIKTINSQSILGSGNIVITGTGISSVTGTAPISSSGGLTPVISISNAAANGTTKGAATFVASDFNDNGSGLISIDYTNGQSASSSTKGFLTSADWTTFNNKQKQITLSVTGNTGPSTFDPTTGVLNVPQYGGEQGSGLGYPLYFGCQPTNIDQRFTTYVFGPTFWGSALPISQDRSSRYLRALKSGNLVSANIVAQWSDTQVGTNLRSNISVYKENSGGTGSSIIIYSGFPMSNDSGYDGPSNLRAWNTLEMINTPFFIQQGEIVQVRFTTPNWPTGTIPLFSLTVVLFIE